jgi:hypothetical protein
MLTFLSSSLIPGLLPLRAARCACWMRPGGAPLPLPVCPLLGLLCFGCAAVPVAGALAVPASLRVSQFRQLLLGAQRARAGSSVTLVFARLRGAGCCGIAGRLYDPKSPKQKISRAYRPAAAETWYTWY